MKLRRSLVTKYVILILASILMWPILPGLYYFPEFSLQQNALYEPLEIEEMWKHTAEQLNEADEHTINEKLSKIQEDYPKAELFWVDKAGKTHMIHKRITEVPDQWTASNLIHYFDRNKEQDLFTVTAVIGTDDNQGFMVFHIPKSTTTLEVKSVYGDFLLILIIIVTGISIVMVSLLFFVGIRKRLVKLRTAMSDAGNNGIPDEVRVINSDEIGQLEQAFNRMVTQLKSSRVREKEEENLRKQWIANISHDLRTPLTVIQQHAYTVQSNPSSPQATKSMRMMINKLNDIGKLLENLLTYTLLSAGKHPIKREVIDVIDEVHHAAVEWYPVLEKEGFRVEIDLPNQVLNWNVDLLWLRCILDNLLQNVIRYAQSGLYIGIGFVERNGMMCLFIEDRGEGIHQQRHI